jgi:phosphoglycerol transferase MdoB-like AlkP superfamily enzyme
MFKVKNVFRREDFFSLLLLLFVYRYCLKYLQGFVINPGSGVRWCSLFIATCPVLFVYLTLRFLLPPFSSAIFSALLILVLSLANTVKMTFVDTPLSWFDLCQVENINIAIQYVSRQQLIGGLVVVSFLGLVLYFEKINHKTGIKKKPIPFLVWIILFVLTIHPFFTTSQNRMSEWLLKETFKYGFGYINWDWRQNVHANGLALHLIQTGNRKIPPITSEKGKKEFENLRVKSPEQAKTKQVVYILCEACWHDEKFFSELFTPIEKRGYQKFRTVSPAYGGGTVNASFELLTGLPSRTNHLNGILYQEYAHQFKKRVLSLPQFLKKNGYKTFVLHNHNRDMWRRDVVMPKFGFDKFLGIEDMDRADSGFFADDEILFKKAIQVAEQIKDQPFFMYLITVFSHGPYIENQGDLGVGDYKRKLSLTIQRFVEFDRQLEKIAPDALVVLLGDHKPGLTKFFYENKVLPRHLIDTDTWWVSSQLSEEIRGDVPVFLRPPKTSEKWKVKEHFNHLPIYCLSEMLDREFLETQLPAYLFSRNNKVCENYLSRGYKATNDSYPSWLYSISLFDNKVDENVTLRLHSLLDF